MIVKTKFNVGDKVYTIDCNTMKVKSFTVSRISTWTTKDATSVTLYDGDSYAANGYDENKCFATEAELMTYVTTNDEQAV